MRLQFSIIIIVFLLCAVTTQSTSDYEGVSWNEEKKLWQAAIFDFNGKIKKFYFDNEFDANKKYKQLCNKMGISPQNSAICELPKQQQNEKKSQYKGVYWHKKIQKWYVQQSCKGGKSKCGGYFDDELDAAKRVNQLCEKLEIPLRNPEISVVPNKQYEEKKKEKSQYKGVFWHRGSGKWCVLICLKGQKTKYGGCFNDELDAAKRVNQLCEELGIPLQNPEISAVPNQQYQKKEKTSQYKGVSRNKERGTWVAKLQVNGKKLCGGIFKDELNAAKKLNQVCEELGIPLLNPGISAIPNQQPQKKEKTSQYKGVCWHRDRKKWHVKLWLKEGKSKFGGYFDHELDAGKRINQLYEELGVALRNPELSAVPNEQHEKKEKASQYKGVYWNKERKTWYVLIRPKGQKPKLGGHFEDELDAAKRLNQVCEELGISLQNPAISAIPNQKYEKKEKTSQYKGVSWRRETKTWRVQLRIKGGKVKYGGMFKDEIDAAKRANQLCEELGIPLQNPKISAKSNQEYQHDDYQIIANPVIDSTISQTDNDDANKKKRNREQEFNDDASDQFYFYDHLLK